MTLRSRLTALERKAGVVGPCRACRGHGSCAFVTYIQGETPPEPEGCHECGCVGHVKIVVTDGTKEEDVA